MKKENKQLNNWEKEIEKLRGELYLDQPYEKEVDQVMNKFKQFIRQLLQKEKEKLIERIIKELKIIEKKEFPHKSTCLIIDEKICTCGADKEIFGYIQAIIDFRNLLIKLKLNNKNS